MPTCARSPRCGTVKSPFCPAWASRAACRWRLSGKYISSWVEMGFDDDAIALAYERTVRKKGSLVWPYMNSILKSWHQKGLHTLQQIKEGDSARKGSYPGGGAAAGTKKDEQSRIEEDLDWMDRYLEKTRGEAQ